MNCNEKIQTGMALVAEGLIEVFKNLTDAINNAFSKFGTSAADWNRFVETYSNRKVVHLAFNASKVRVRKKNMARLMRAYRRFS